MIFFELEMKYIADEGRKEAGLNEKLQIEKDCTDSSTAWINLIKGVNRTFGNFCAFDGEMSLFVWKATPGLFNLIIAVNLEKVKLNNCMQYIQNEFCRKYAITDVNLKIIKELSTSEFSSAGDRGSAAGYIPRWSDRALRNDFFDNCSFKVEEHITSDEKLSLEAAMEAADKILADKSFYEELQRIYSEDNAKEYYGNPVHYCINATNDKSAKDIIDILAHALCSNNRLLGKRVAYITEISENCYRDEDVKNLIMNAQGCIVVLDMSSDSPDLGNYATAFQMVIESFDHLVRKYNLNTLFIMIKQSERPGFSEAFLTKVSDSIDIITLKEGVGGRQSAYNYLRTIISSNGFKVTDVEIDNMLGKAKSFSVTDIYEIYNNWFKNGLRTNIYKAYANCLIEEKEEKIAKSSPYEELNSMVGLTEIKAVVNDIIYSNKIAKIRKDRGLNCNAIAKHMIFTGNPGSAKTTVARLVADILRLEGVLETGKFVECGRADLVGKYVGWTARLVREKFRAAKGGILFIDEAYALADKTGSFGEEAINTIVQEMENHREEVIVIFAGYKDSMEKFLNFNEGLKSRIAFHLDFPDYSPTELVEILKIMANNRGLSIEPKALNKCFDIFVKAASESDFGNGRFVRNLIEQAEMAQAKRLYKVKKCKEISNKMLTTLIAEDFDTNASKKYELPHKKIGFII